MRLASITLPCSPVDCYCQRLLAKRRRMDAAHEEITGTLLNWCRGYTRLSAVGAWVFNDGTPCDEAVYRYEFTSPDTQTARDELVALAYRIKTISDEEAIFIVHANGNTEIVR